MNLKDPFIATFFGVLTVVVLCNVRDIRKTIDNTQRSTANVATATANIASASKELNETLAVVHASVPEIMEDLHKDTHEIFAAINGKHGLKEVLLNVDMLTANARKTSIVVAQATKDQKADIHEAMQALLATVKNVDANVNGEDGVLVSLNNDLKRVDATLQGLAGEHGLLTESAKTLKVAGDLLQGQDIVDIKANLAGMTAHLDGAAKNAEEGIGYARDALKPTKLTFKQTLLNAALGGIPSGAINFFLRWKPQRVEVVKEAK